VLDDCLVRPQVQADGDGARAVACRQRPGLPPALRAGAVVREEPMLPPACPGPGYARAACGRWQPTPRRKEQAIPTARAYPTGRTRSGPAAPRAQEPGSWSSGDSQDREQQSTGASKRFSWPAIRPTPQRMCGDIRPYTPGPGARSVEETSEA
jgi:hypothetical protein